MNKSDKPELNISELSGRGSKTPAAQSAQSTPRSPKIDLRGNSLTDKSLTKKQALMGELESFKKKQRWRNIRFALISFVVFALIFNYQVIYSQFLYLFAKNSAPTGQTPSTPTTSTPPAAQPATPAAAPQPTPAETVGPENIIIIPKIKVNAPLVFPESIKEDAVLAALQGGVAHYAGTANPGESGNAVFFGHSSNDWWQPGGYKFVFVLLEKLTPGDNFEIHYNSHKYVYAVTGTRVVMPTDISVLTQTTDPTATLITCTPPGTSWKRFVVSAKQIEPAPVAPQTQTATTQSPAQTASAAAAVPTPVDKVLPSAAPSLVSQIVDFFAGLWNTITGHKASPAPQAQPASPAPAAAPQHLPDVQ